MKAFILALTGLILISSSCQLTEQPKDKNAKGNGFTNNRVNEVYVNRDKNKNNFLFLSYWAGMNRAEFDIITDSLINSGYLNRDEEVLNFTLSYNYNEQVNINNRTNNDLITSCDFILSPKYLNNNLYCIELVSKNVVDIETILYMYENKYGEYKEEKPELMKYKGMKSFYRYKQYIWKLNDTYITITEDFGLIDIYSDFKVIGKQIGQTSVTICYETDNYNTFKSRLTKEREEYEKNKIKEKKAIEKTKELI